MSGLVKRRVTNTLFVLISTVQSLFGADYVQGFLDGISSPAIEALTGKLPGQIVIPPGIIICGTDGDNVTTRPSWAKNGTFLVYVHRFSGPLD